MGRQHGRVQSTDIGALRQGDDQCKARRKPMSHWVTKRGSKSSPNILSDKNKGLQRMPEFNQFWYDA
jgi:hypothetical protein